MREYANRSWVVICAVSRISAFWRRSSRVVGEVDQTPLLLTGRLYRRVCSRLVSAATKTLPSIIRRPNATTRYHKIVVLGHPPRCFYNLFFIVGNNFDSLQLYAQGETEFRKVRAVRVDCLRAALLSAIHVLWAMGAVRTKTCLSAQHLIAYDYAASRVYHSLPRYRHGFAIG